MTTHTVRGRSKILLNRIWKSTNAFCHLLRNSGTTTVCRFRLLSCHVPNLQLHNILVAALSQEVCVTNCN
jgi:hypothetical protein